MIRPLVRTAGIGIALYLLLKIWVHYQAHQWLESLKGELEFHAAINYDWLASSPFLGEVELIGLRITPFQLRQPLSAESLVLDFGGLPDLLTLALSNAEGFSPPRVLGIRLTRLQVPVAERWSAYGSNPFPALLSLLRPPCGSTDPLSVAFLHDLGLAWLTFGGELEYSYDPDVGRLEYRHDLAVDEMGAFALQLKADGLGLPGNRSMADGEPLVRGLSGRLRSLDVRIEDRALLRVLNRTCALALGVAGKDYPTLAWRDLEKDLDALGIRVGTGMAAALADFLKGEGSLRMKVATAEDFNPASWFRQLPGAVSERVPLTLAVNDRMVIDPYYEIDFSRLLPLLAPPPLPVVSGKTPGAPRPDVARPDAARPVAARPEGSGQSRTRSYVSVELAALTLYSGFPVRLKHRDGKITTGVLGEVRANSIDVRVPMASGDVVFHVAPADVQSAEVLQ